eukprot:Selendium_serpulae@DN6398_c0_g2_i5.p1
MGHMLQRLVQIYWLGAIVGTLGSTISSELNTWSRHGKLAPPLNKRGTGYLSKHRFRDFYIVGLTVVLLTVALLNGAVQPHLCVMMVVHLTRRFLEHLFVFRPTENSVMHIMAYFLGCSFYVVMPISFLRSGSQFKTSYVCVVQFIAFSLIQTYSHFSLASLRKTTCTQEHSCPNGGLFSIITCPHYLAEMGIYSCWALQIPCSETILCLLFVILTMIVSARRTHLWYTQKWPECKSKSALFPYVF